jgi:hypothetical protein
MIEETSESEGGVGFEPGSAPTARDYANLFLRPLDLDRQLAAFRTVLTRNKDVDDATSDALVAQRDEILAPNAFSPEDGSVPIEHAIDNLQDQYEGSTYLRAAHSLAAAGMLAPLLETLFIRLLKVALAISESSGQPLSAPRWQQASKARADCRCFFDETKGKFTEPGLMRSVRQFIASLPGPPLLDDAALDTLDVLFRYRNEVLHNGVELPEAKAVKFNTYLREALPAHLEPEQAPRLRWVTVYFRGSTPWLFLLKDGLWLRCLSLIREFADAVGARYLELEMPRRPRIADIAGIATGL